MFYKHYTIVLEAHSLKPREGVIKKIYKFTQKRHKH